MSEKPAPARPRLWPALVIILIAAALLLWNALRPEAAGQSRFLMGAAISIGAAIVMLLWALLFSRLRWRTRSTVLLVVVVLVGGAASTLEIADVDGNLVPTFRWRWAERESLPPPATTANSNSSEYEVPTPEGAADFAQFLGARRDGTVSGIELARDWSRQPPREVWRRAVGAAYSGFAISGARAITLEQRDTVEAIVCYALATGKILWASTYEARYESTIGGVGPRSTPTIEDAAVYTYGATGVLSRLDLMGGTLRWRTNVVEDVSGSVPHWGMSSSPLLVERLVVVCSGGREGKALAAYDREDGSRVWTGGDRRIAYSSPMLVELAGVAQIIVLNHHALVGHDPETGAVLWSHPWPGDQPKVAQPVDLGEDRLFVSSGYGVGAASYRIERSAADDGEARWRAIEEYRSNRMKAKFANMILADGQIYGLDDGILASVDPASGERNWKKGRHGHGQLLLVGDLLLVTTEPGDIVLVEPNPDEYRELTRINAFDTKTWNSPALAGRYLLVRNHVEAACYELPLAQ